LEYQGLIMWWKGRSSCRHSNTSQQLVSSQQYRPVSFWDGWI